MILNDNLWAVMVKLSWPAVIAMVLYGLNTVFDAIFVGRFVGETALAGVSLAYPLSQLSLGFGSLIGVGAGSVLSIALGAGDRDTQKKLIGNVNYLNVLYGIGLTLAGLVAAGPLVRMMGGAGEELIFGIDYFRVTLAGSIFWIAGLSGNMIVRSEGKMGSAAIMMAMGLVVNIIANYILIVLFGFGVKGAAWGTNLGMLVYTVVFFVYTSGGRVSFDANPFSFSRDKEILKLINSNGFPSLIMQFMTLIQGIVVLNALQPAVGINFGAEKYKRVIGNFKIFGAAATILMAPFWVIMMVNPELVLHLMLPARNFSGSDIANFRIFMALLPVLPILFMAMTFFPAINNSKPVSIMGIARQLVFYVPLMLTLPKFFGVRWVYIGSFCIDLVIIIWVFFMVSAEFGKLRRGNVNKDRSLSGC